MKYDKKQVFDEQIRPLIDQALERCVANGIPMVAGVQVACHDAGAEVATFMFAPARLKPVPAIELSGLFLAKGMPSGLRVNVLSMSSAPGVATPAGSTRH